MSTASARCASAASSPIWGSSPSPIPGRESHTISTLRLPDFLTVDGLYRGLKQRGFVIYGCKGELAARHVQIANMGEISDATLDAFLAAVTEVVAQARPVVDARPALKSV